MSRPQKKGLDYFPFDVDFFDDKKIKVLKGRYGADGVTVYIYLLTLIYRENGYFIRYDDDLKYIISDDLNMNDNKIGQIINFLLERSLFDNTLFKSDKVLTSRGIQLRFQEATKSRGSKKIIEIDRRLWVLEKDETQSHIKCVNFFDENNKSENNPHFSENNPDKSEIYFTKKSKVKKSKVNKITNDGGLSLVVSAYQNNIAPIKATVRDSIIDWLNVFDADVIIWAIEYAVKMNKGKWGYVEGILRNQLNSGNKTLADIKSSEKNYRKSKDASGAVGSLNDANAYAYDYDDIEKRMWANIKKSI